MRPQPPTPLCDIALAAAVAHEVRRVLTPASGYAQLAIEAGGLGAEADRALRALLAACQDAQDVLEALTSTSGSESVADVADIVSQVAGIKTAIPPHCLAAISGSKLRIVIENLVRNARRAQDGGDVQVTCRSTGNSVRISVDDSGVGMSPDQLAAAVQPFVSFSASTGMGLAICRHIVEAAGGSIRIASSLGRGTSVTIDLPAATPSARKAA